METDTEVSDDDKAYWDVLSALSRGTIVSFNRNVPGRPETPELTVVRASDDSVLLSEDRWSLTDPDWEVTRDEEGSPVLKEEDSREEFIATIMVEGFNGGV